MIKILKVNSTVNLENDICIFGFWFSNVKIRAYCIKVSCPRNGRGAHTTGWVVIRQSALRQDFPGGSDGKESVYNAGDLGLIPGLGRSPGEGNDNPLQYYCLENPMNGGARKPLAFPFSLFLLNTRACDWSPCTRLVLFLHRQLLTEDGWMASPTQWTWVWANSRGGEGQGSLACCSPWGRKEWDTTEQLNNSDSPRAKIQFPFTLPQELGSETIYFRLGLRTQPKPMVFQLRSQTWFRDLMKFRFLMSYHRKNSVRQSDR